jgi:hypothetical protein
MRKLPRRSGKILLESRGRIDAADVSDFGVLLFNNLLPLLSGWVSKM